MKILYQRSNKTFLVKNDSKTYFVSLPKNRADIVDDITAQELLQQGYWDLYDDKNPENKKIKEGVALLIDSI